MEGEGLLKFITKDSGKRDSFASGMVRDTQDDKPIYTLLDFPMLKRWAQLMVRGMKKYGRDNWRKAAGEEELQRFKDSALRHMIQWLEGDVSEDHAAACYFNIAGAEMVKAKLAEAPEIIERHCCGDCFDVCTCTEECLK